VTLPITIVLIEDESPMRHFLRAAFGNAAITLIEAATARDGLAQVAGRRPDLVLLDLGLPDLDGLEVVRRIREWSRVPIIVLSARGREGDKVAALDAGADDYLTKPFGVDELMARIRVARRHAITQVTPEPVVSVGPLRIDFGMRTVHREGVEVRLTPTEYKLLAVLAQHAGKVLTHRQLLREVWGLHTEDQVHYLRVYTAQLRRKIEADPSRPTLLINEPGVGYRLRGE
jgi:two-component system KDP operon response regulator KdpE